MAKTDRIDDGILQILSANGRISNLELAGKVGLSPSACLRRVTALERDGVIAGYRAVLDPAARGIRFIAYVAVGLKEHTKRAMEEFERAIAAAPEVRECHGITGDREYLLRVEVADLADYKRFHTDVVGTLPQVSAITTYVVVASSKDERA